MILSRSSRGGGLCGRHDKPCVYRGYVFDNSVGGVLSQLLSYTLRHATEEQQVLILHLGSMGTIYTTVFFRVNWVNCSGLESLSRAVPRASLSCC